GGELQPTIEDNYRERNLRLALYRAKEREKEQLLHSFGTSPSTITYILPPYVKSPVLLTFPYSSCRSNELEDNTGWHRKGSVLSESESLASRTPMRSQFRASLR
ncbi:hypothetical protein SARC_15235, partial [Sphaeroforma arctica JP610]